MANRTNPRSMSYEQREAQRQILLGDITPTEIWSDGKETYTVYFYNNHRGLPCLLAYRGKSLKPALYYRYPQKNAREARYERARRFVDSVAAAQQETAKRRASKRQPHSLKVGDILCSTWGYDQTNIDYYEVVALNGQTMVTVRPIAQQTESDGFMQGTCAPLPGHYTGQPHRHKVDPQCNAIRLNSFAFACRIEPVARAGSAPVYESARWTAYA